MRDYASTSFWLETADDDLTPRPGLDGSVDVDVAILGAGYTGLWTAYYLLTRALLALHPPESQLAVAIGNDRKGRLSAVAYVVAVGIAFAAPWVAIAIYVAVAVAWLVPDRRITRVIGLFPETEGSAGS